MLPVLPMISIERSRTMVKHKKIVPNGHSKMRTQNRVCTLANQPIRKTRKRSGRVKKFDTCSKPTDGIVGPIVQCQTLENNRKSRGDMVLSLEKPKGKEIICIREPVRLVDGADEPTDSDATREVSPPERSLGEGHFLPPPDDIRQQQDDIVVVDSETGNHFAHHKMRLQDIDRLPESHRIIVTFNEYGQPLMKAGGLYTRYLGKIARKGNMCPLSYKDWRMMPDYYTSAIVRNVERSFVLPPNHPKVISWTLKSVGRKWKEYKYDLRVKFYVGNMTIDQLIEHIPPDVDKQQWIDLVHSWASPKGQAISRRGKEARRAAQSTHTCGAKSFAQIRHEFEAQEGRPPSRVELFQRTHTKKNRQYTDVAACQFVEEAQRTVDERMHASPGVSRVELEDQIFAQLMGEERPGRVRGFGLGVTPTQVFGPRASLVVPEVGPVHIGVETQLAQMEQRFKAEQEQRDRAHREEMALLMNHMSTMQEYLRVIMAAQVQVRPMVSSHEGTLGTPRTSTDPMALLPSSVASGDHMTGDSPDVPLDHDYRSRRRKYSHRSPPV